ncbi:MAG: ATP synthase F1 subunit delta [Patescibacteria group bacterium]|nr:ATP synthase F1 subunit delta [Patescibacteria group bacterium]
MSKSLSEIKQYVQALYDLASSENILDKINLELRLFIAKTNEDLKLKKYLSNPIENIVSKKATIKDLFQDQLSTYTHNFIYIFLKKNELEILEAAQKYFEKLIKERKNVIDAKIISAIPLTKDEENIIKEKLATQTNKKINLNIAVDPNILGGLVIQTRDQMVDASLLGKINNLRQNVLS